MGGLFVVDILVAEDFLKSCQHDGDIGFKGEIVDIPDVEAEFFSPGEIVAAMALRPSGDAGSHVVAAHLLGRVKRQILHQQRARADERHVAFEHVPELWQLIERGIAHEGSELRYALFVGQQFAVGSFPLVHGLELDDAERLPLESGSLLEEEDSGSFVEEVQKSGHCEQHRAEHKQHACAGGYVDEAFEKSAIHVTLFFDASACWGEVFVVDILVFRLIVGASAPEGSERFGLHLVFEVAELVEI